MYFIAKRYNRSGKSLDEVESDSIGIEAAVRKA